MEPSTPSFRNRLTPELELHFGTADRAQQTAEMLCSCFRSGKGAISEIQQRDQGRLLIVHFQFGEVDPSEALFFVLSVVAEVSNKSPVAHRIYMPLSKKVETPNPQL